MPSPAVAPSLLLGLETNLSARPLSVGNGEAGAAPAVVAEGGAGVDGVTGIETDGGVGGPAAAAVAAVAPIAGVADAAKFVDDGGAAGVNPATATACGLDWAEGSSGFAERATADESSGALSRLNQANRCTVWQPVAATTTAKAIDQIAVRFITNAR